jgi:hypothetical protein
MEVYMRVKNKQTAVKPEKLPVMLPATFPNYLRLQCAKNYIRTQ